jgi:alpha-amylase/alpha-mannosidase (GH57 family)
VKRDEEVQTCPVCEYHAKRPRPKKNYEGRTITRRQWLREIDARVQIRIHTEALLNLYGVREKELKESPEAFEYYLQAIEQFIE